MAEPIHQQQNLRNVIDRKIETDDLRKDTAQDQAISTLDDLLTALRNPPLGNKASALGWLFGKRNSTPTGPRGVYLWGGVGRGKSMLMDTFFALAPKTIGGAPKKRVHFHAFMQNIHQQIHEWRQLQKNAAQKSSDPVPPLATKLAKEARLLCFDEFAVTDVADAMILARLFTALFENGVTVVATSNVEPDQLYKDGLNRSFFLPFVDLVKSRMQVLELASNTDHRTEKIVKSDVYFIKNSQGFDALWADTMGENTQHLTEIEVKGRTLTFDQSAGGVVRTSFKSLCEMPLGAGDYLAIADRFHTFFVDDIPVMEHADRNAVKRFITLIDTLYEAGRILIVSAHAAPADLYRVDHGTEAFEFKRTVSRLREMQSAQWFAKRNP